MRASCGWRDWEIGKRLNGRSASLLHGYMLASSEERASTAAIAPVVQARRLAGLQAEWKVDVSFYQQPDLKESINKRRDLHPQRDGDPAWLL
jgi:hypothetical protein